MLMYHFVGAFSKTRLLYIFNNAGHCSIRGRMPRLLKQLNKR
jgi:hypothetical protein